MLCLCSVSLVLWPSSGWGLLRLQLKLQVASFHFAANSCWAPTRVVNQTQYQPHPTTDAEYDHDAGLEHLDRKDGRRGAREKEATKEKQRQIREYQRHSSALVGPISWVRGFRGSGC